MVETATGEPMGVGAEEFVTRLIHKGLETYLCGGDIPELTEVDLSKLALAVRGAQLKDQEDGAPAGGSRDAAAAAGSARPAVTRGAV